MDLGALSAVFLGKGFKFYQSEARKQCFLASDSVGQNLEPFPKNTVLYKVNIARRCRGPLQISPKS